MFGSRMWGTTMWGSSGVTIFALASACRLQAVDFEDRFFDVSFEDRFFGVPAESRTSKPLCNTTEEQ